MKDNLTRVLMPKQDKPDKYKSYPNAPLQSCKHCIPPFHRSDLQLASLNLACAYAHATATCAGSHTDFNRAFPEMNRRDDPEPEFEFGHGVLYWIKVIVKVICAWRSIEEKNLCEDWRARLSDT
jgi:hypothetical protein